MMHTSQDLVDMLVRCAVHAAEGGHCAYDRPPIKQHYALEAIAKAAEQKVFVADIWVPHFVQAGDEGGIHID